MQLDCRRVSGTADRADCTGEGDSFSGGISGRENGQAALRQPAPRSPKGNGYPRAGTERHDPTSLLYVNVNVAVLNSWSIF